MKKWTPGEADEPWKVMVCAHDAMVADETISRLVYILTDAGHDLQKGLGALRCMTGAQIVDGLIHYQASAHRSVANGLQQR